MIQLIAASESGRSLTYFTFGNADQAAELTQVYAHLVLHEITTGELYEALIQYCSARKSGEHPKLFDFLELFLGTEPSALASLAQPEVEVARPGQPAD